MCGYDGMADTRLHIGRPYSHERHGDPIGLQDPSHPGLVFDSDRRRHAERESQRREDIALAKTPGPLQQHNQEVAAWTNLWQFIENDLPIPPDMHHIGIQDYCLPSRQLPPSLCVRTIKFYPNVLVYKGCDITALVNYLFPACKQAFSVSYHSHVIVSRDDAGRCNVRLLPEGATGEVRWIVAAFAKAAKAVRNTVSWSVDLQDLPKIDPRSIQADTIVRFLARGATRSSKERMLQMVKEGMDAHFVVDCRQASLAFPTTERAALVRTVAPLTVRDIYRSWSSWRPRWMSGPPSW